MSISKEEFKRRFLADFPKDWNELNEEEKKERIKKLPLYGYAWLDEDELRKYPPIPERNEFFPDQPVPKNFLCWGDGEWTYSDPDEFPSEY